MKMHTKGANAHLNDNQGVAAAWYFTKGVANLASEI